MKATSRRLSRLVSDSGLETHSEEQEVSSDREHGSQQISFYACPLYVNVSLGRRHRGNWPVFTLEATRSSVEVAVK